MASDHTRPLTQALVASVGAGLEAARLAVEMLDRVVHMARGAVRRAVNAETELERVLERRQAVEVEAVEKFGRELDRAMARRRRKCRGGQQDRDDGGAGVAAEGGVVEEEKKEEKEDGGAAADGESCSEYMTASSCRSDAADKGSSNEHGYFDDVD